MLSSHTVTSSLTPGSAKTRSMTVPDTCVLFFGLKGIKDASSKSLAMFLSARLGLQCKQLQPWSCVTSCGKCVLASPATTIVAC